MTPRKTKAAAAIASETVDDGELDRLVGEAFADIKSRLGAAKQRTQAAPGAAAGGLLSALDAGIDTSALYIRYGDDQVASGTTGPAVGGLQSAIDAKVAKAMDALGNLEKSDTVQSYKTTSLELARKKKRDEVNDNAGKGWYNLPATPITPELKRDLQLLRMRNVLDRKRHYKANDMKTLPKYFQVGRIIEGAGEFFSSRIPKAHRKQTLVDELLSDAKFKKYAKKKFVDVQTANAGGRKAHYKGVKNMRKPKWAKE